MNELRDLMKVRSEIEKNYRFIRAVEKMIDRENDDVEKAKLISIIARLYSEYVTGVYSSSYLEEALIKLGQKIEFFPTKQPQKGRFLIVMTLASWGGGHSQVVNNWIKCDKENQYSIAFTEMMFIDVPEFLRDEVKESGGKILCLRGNILEKAQKLLELSQEYEGIILFTHMEDVIPTLAYGHKEWKIPVYFFNHADFRFSLGCSIADVFLNMNIFDKKKAVEYRGIREENSVLLQAPGFGSTNIREIEYKEKEKRVELAKIFDFDPDSKLVVSMGEHFKYQKIIGADFCEFAKSLVRESDKKITFLVIGPDETDSRWTKMKTDTEGKAKALGYLPRERANELISVSDLYIVSFPMTSSGLAVAEMAEKPYLALHLIERESERFDVSSAKSIDELLEKAKEALFVNPQKYMGHCGRHKWSELYWCKTLHDIYEQTRTHAIYSFETKRYIQAQEYINYQLMQEQAERNVVTYINNSQLNKKHKKKILWLKKWYRR